MARSKLTLQDVARAAADRNGGKGGRGLGRLAESKGLTLSYATVDRILAGKYESRPQRQTIEALAVLADMPIETVYEAAGLPLPMAPLADQLPDGSDQLSVDQRRVVLDVIRGFIRDNDRMTGLEQLLDERPLHPKMLARRLEQVDLRHLGDDELDDLHTKLALALPDDEQRTILWRAFEDADAELAARRDDRRTAPADGGRVADPAGRDGVTPGAGLEPEDPAARDELVKKRDRRRKSAQARDVENTARRPLPADVYGLAAHTDDRALDADDAAAAARGEENQDTEDG